MAEIKQMSENGINFLSELEGGMYLHPYLDIRKIPTISVGVTYWEDGTKVRITDSPITLERATSLFRNTLSYYETSVYSVTRDDINQNQFDSLVCIAFNIGVQHFKDSTLLRLVNENPNNPEITQAFEMWKNAGEFKGILLPRRKKEATLYFTV